MNQDKQYAEFDAACRALARQSAILTTGMTMQLPAPIVLALLEPLCDTIDRVRRSVVNEDFVFRGTQGRTLGPAVEQRMAEIAGSGDDADEFLRALTEEGLSDDDGG